MLEFGFLKAAIGANSMKDLFKSKNKSASLQAQGDKHPVASRNEVAAFLNKVATIPQTGGDARLVFALDATASRQPTWDVASQLQLEMFDKAQALGGLNLQLCYFRGFGEFFASDWQSDGKKLMSIMTRIHCEAGATQIKRLLNHAIRETERNKIKGLVFIGDAMEENRDLLAQQAGKLGLLNVPIFIFQEGGDPVARASFEDLCRLSGGAYSQFDSSSASQLAELLSAVAIYAAGGLKALKDFSKSSSQSVKLLEQQLRS